MSGVIHTGPAAEILATLPAASVHCVVTSPPYWGLRNYGVAGQLGLEATPEEYVSALVETFRQVWRVLRPDGSLWLNLGDTFFNHSPTRKRAAEAFEGTYTGGLISTGERRRASGHPVLKMKDLVGIPWRVAFALQADGWYLRMDNVWSKLNPMPEPVTDRPTMAHEYVFLLTKSTRYFYDSEAIREPFADARQGRDGSRRPSERNRGGRTDGYTKPNGIDPSANGGRNCRSVWEIATQPYPGAHFATFPEKLAARCILAGSSERGVCAVCGAPWRRQVQETAEYAAVKARLRKTLGPNFHMKRAGLDAVKGVGTGGNPATLPPKNITIGWLPSCTHDAPTRPATVLDPFAGSGTTVAVAERLGRDWIAVELKPEYVRLIEERTAQRGMLGMLTQTDGGSDA